MKKSDSIVEFLTTRNTDFIAKALAYAIGAIDALPPGKGELSDRDDMAAILHHLLPNQSDRLNEAKNVEHHTGFRPDLEFCRTSRRPNYPASLMNKPR